MLMKNEIIKEKIKHFNNSYFNSKLDQYRSSRNQLVFADKAHTSTTLAKTPNIDLTQLTFRDSEKAPHLMREATTKVPPLIHKPNAIPKPSEAKLKKLNSLIKIRFESPVVTMKAINKYMSQNRNERFLDAQNQMVTVSKNLNLV
jgi:hypothetical protein